MHAIHPLHKVLIIPLGTWLAKGKADDGVWNPASAVHTAPPKSIWGVIMQQIKKHAVHTLRVHEPMRWRRSLNAFLMVLEIGYIFIVATCFELFNCFYQRDGSANLVANANVVCFESDWFDILPYTIVFVVIYVFLVPAVFLYALSLVHGQKEALMMESKVTCGRVTRCDPQGTH